MSRTVQGGAVVRRKSWAAVALIIFSLLIFTTVYTSPISAGFAPGSHLVKTTLKERHSTIQELASIRPVLNLMAFVTLTCAILCVVDNAHLTPRPFFGRYFNLPPPIA